jgi:hypothetical protein
MRLSRLVSVVMMLSVSSAVFGQSQFLGKVWVPKYAEVAEKMPPNTGMGEDYFAPGRPGDGPDILPLSNIRCFANLDGSGSEALGSRTWELAPSGWYRMSGIEGRYTMLFTGPANLIRPVVVTNVFTKSGETIDRKIVPPFDYGVFFDGAYDEKAATDYYQTFIAKGTSVTDVGFRFVHDGVDGIGPGTQTLIVSIHKQGAGTPDKWEQVGPAMPILNMDSGGPKNYDWSAGWNSGEVPLTPGQKYAVHVRAEKAGGVFQAFWRPTDNKEIDCYRLGTKGATGWVGRNLYMSVGTDCDGLVIPYNKRIQKDCVDFSGFARKWSQTYVAQGRSLAGAIMYIATSGIQPGISRQRVVVRVHEGGPDGKVVGIEKIGIGSGIFTGDAAWGTFGVVYSPGEVPLEPGKTYAIEMESIENYESLHGYKNIKGMLSDDKPGFNPYKKVAPDTYGKGTAYKNGKDDVGFDLDMQIIEYGNEAKDWDRAVDAANLLVNGDMEAGELDEKSPDKGQAQAWKSFGADAGTAHQYLADPPENKSRILRVTAGAGAKSVDGGYVQKITGLKRLDTYRLAGKVRSSWPADVERNCQVGYDLTGQDTDPKAATIVWESLPAVHSIWVDYKAGPIRPARDTISVWLRGWAKSASGTPFKADFDEFSLHRVRTDVPGATVQAK